MTKIDSKTLSGTDDTAIQTALGVLIGTDVQAYDAALGDLAGLSLVQGDILYHNGTNLVRLAAGTSGMFLKTMGASANPVWAGAGIGWAPVAKSGAITGSPATVDFTSIGSHDIYLVEFHNLLPATDAVELRMRVTDDGGTSWHGAAGAGEEDYLWGLTGQISTGTALDQTAGASTGRQYAGLAVGAAAASNIGNLASEVVNGRLVITKGDGGTTGHTHWEGAFSWKNGASGMFASVGGTMQEGSGIAVIDGLRFYFSAGNFANQGQITVWGKSVAY